MTSLSSPSPISILFYTLVIFFTTFATISGSYGGNESDHLALSSFKSLISDPYGALTSWNSSSHFCNWSGVSCGWRHRRVTVIQLQSEGLQGSLSPHIGNLSFLRVLSLDNNSFQGTIPHELGRLFRLRFLGLALNKFNGVIPTNLSGCYNLEVLQLGWNNLVGSIPLETSFLSKLTLLSMDDNDLTGGIPPFLGNLTSLEAFSVRSNPLGGSIPDTLGRLKSSRKFYAEECNLHGTIPHSIYNLSLLTNFTLADNQLTGTLPLTIGSMLPNLQYFQLWGNQLSGLLPPSISNCSKLDYLDMSNNSFSGKLTIDFANLKDISFLSLQKISFNGGGEANGMKFIDALGNCSKLEVLLLGLCNFQGVVPTSIGNLSHQLSVLELGQNQLYGSLPSSIGNLVGLTMLGLGGNRFTGKIPSTIGMLQKLQRSYLYKNQFSGPIPYAIGNLSMLNLIHLYSNRLEGDIPPTMGNCHQLEVLTLMNNKLSGKIPKQLLQLTSLTLLNVSNNSLSGSLPTEVEDLKSLNLLDLSHNHLSGNIPSSLGGCTSLTYLYINDNLFEGMVPPSLSSVRGLAELDLSHNNLSGQIPQYLEWFSLEYLNLSFNDFHGQVPVNGVFANASAFSILGNNRLCGGLVELRLPKCKMAEKHNKRFTLFIIVILVSCTVFFILCFVYAWFKKKKNGQPSQSSNDERFLKVSYDQLLKATDGFSEANLIGQGGSSSVYKGTLDHDDKFVAVKVLHLQLRGAHKSFIAECQAWRSIRHRNLLKIITSCSSIDFQGNDFKALVYEFMANGSLHDWLHSNANTSRLDLFQRINILIDVAHALDYLHNQCLPTVVHGDMKPSNILLDNDMVAHVGDFGLAKFLGTNSNQNSSTGVKGTIGYAPPEYGLGSKMTSSGDVYSFGIVLLEVMTGKKPTDDIFSEDLSLHKFAYVALLDQVIDVIDGDVVMQSTEANAQKMEECLASTIRIGVSCSIDSPSQRMNINNVVHELLHVRDALQNLEIGAALKRSNKSVQLSKLTCNGAEKGDQCEEPTPKFIAEVLSSHLSNSASAIGLSIKACNGHINFYSADTQLQADVIVGRPAVPKDSSTSSSSKERSLTNSGKFQARGQTLEIRLKRSSFDPEEHELYKKYQIEVHNDAPGHVSESSYKRFVVDSPLIFVPSSGDSSVPPCGFGSFHQHYLINGRLVAVGVIDILPKCLSSKYLFWGPDFAFLSLGKYSALQEINWVRDIQSHCPSLQCYYLGYYIHSCNEMRYKAAYHPSELLCPLCYQWVRYDIANRLLDRNPYVVLSDFATLQNKVASTPNAIEDQRKQDESNDLTFNANEDMSGVS